MKRTVFFRFPMTTTHLGANPRYSTLLKQVDDSSAGKDMMLDGYFELDNINNQMLPTFLWDWYNTKLPTPEPKATPIDSLVAFIQETVTNGAEVRGIYACFEVVPTDLTIVGMQWSTKVDENENEVQKTWQEYGVAMVDGKSYVTTSAQVTGHDTGDADYWMSNADLKRVLDAGYTLLTALPQSENEEGV